ncbi:MAG: glycine cleavage T C-terminal barrel domain-containing protein [Acidobacteriota bacterium]|nr:glycine cleavage T C-terminal barrel domain-containing protein [Acidobacteriota bacterium]
MFSLDGYRALRTSGGAVRRVDRGVLAVAGRDRAAWLQGLVTNDVEALGEGQGCYAAYLTPQGRMITDMNILARRPRLLLDVPAPLAASLRDRLDGLIFTEDAQVTDESASLSVWTVFGPAKESGSGLRAPGSGTTVFADRGQPPPFPEVDLDTYEVVRIEDGVPKFLVDMNEDTIPLEAGIEDRAISFTKGCYVGQEVIVRVTHRGGGRVAKRLVRWKAAGAGEPTGGDKPFLSAEALGAKVEGLSLAPGARIFSGDRDIGRVTSAAFSPAQNAIVGLGYLHRDFVDRGTEVTVVWNDARTQASIQ